MLGLRGDKVQESKFRLTNVESPNPTKFPPFGLGELESLEAIVVVFEVCRVAVDSRGRD